MICMIDRKKMCPDCAISFNQQKICAGCLQTRHPISKQGYKILVVVANRIDRTGEIHEITKIPKKNIDSSMHLLRNSGYIARKGLTGHKVTDSGMNMIAAYRQVYGSDGDISTLDREMRKYIGVL